MKVLLNTILHIFLLFQQMTRFGGGKNLQLVGDTETLTPPAPPNPTQVFNAP